MYLHFTQISTLSCIQCVLAGHYHGAEEDKYYVCFDIKMDFDLILRLIQCAG